MINHHYYRTKPVFVLLANKGGMVETTPHRVLKETDRQLQFSDLNKGGSKNLPRPKRIFRTGLW